MQYVNLLNSLFEAKLKEQLSNDTKKFLEKLVRPPRCNYVDFVLVLSLNRELIRWLKFDVANIAEELLFLSNVYIVFCVDKGIYHFVADFSSFKNFFNDFTCTRRHNCYK